VQASSVATEVMKLCAEDRYEDFGPTLMAEELEKKGIVVDHDTVRRCCGCGRADCAAPTPTAPAMAGAQAVLWGDGATGCSHHDWFEGRRAKCVLMVMVDDATTG